MTWLIIVTVFGFWFVYSKLDEILIKIRDIDFKRESGRFLRPSEDGEGLEPDWDAIRGDLNINDKR